MIYTRIASLKKPDAFREYLKKVGAEIPFDETLAPAGESPLGEAYALKNGFRIGNRFCILPMEGWDGTGDGRPSELTRRRWERFGLSGAKLIWGGEAVAVRHDGRANPNQLLIGDGTLRELERLRGRLVEVHREHHGTTDDLYIGLQLTHSGRFCRPNDKKRLEPWVLYHHPVLDRKFGLKPEDRIFSDGEIEDLVRDFVRASRQAHEIGFQFVDLKHCHGYLGHEFLTAVDRPGNYGGSFENRTRFLRELVAGIRSEVPGLSIGVRLSAFDFVPFKPGEDRIGVPDMPPELPYRHGFGGDGSGVGIDLREAHRFLDLLKALDIELVCISAGSPYYNPHIQRPALFPPSDGYQPPEDPLVGVARQIHCVAELKRSHPDLAVVGSAYTYLQEWLPNVGQHLVREGMVDFIGLGRMVLSYPEMPAHVLSGTPLDRKSLCRTFSDCTTGPRNGLVSGCYPLDEHYKALPEAEVLKEIKKNSG